MQFHGDYSPGGGSRLALFSVLPVLLYALVFGLDATAKVFTDKVLISIASLGVLLYACTGVVSMFKGGDFLNYSLLAEQPVSGQHIGIIVIEFVVGMTVASVMLLMFFTSQEG